jgi:Flp pilus assembly pilin Flp
MNALDDGEWARPQGILRSVISALGGQKRKKATSMMGKVRCILSSLWADAKGVSSLEYAVLASGIVLAIVALWAPTIGASVESIFAQVGNNL